MALPVKGQEFLLSVISPDGLEDKIDHIKSVDFTFDLETISESYLGQNADQFDEIFRGVTVEVTFDVASRKVFDFITKLVNRAQRRTASGETFNIVGAFKFPNGDRRRFLFPDLHFGEIPFGFGGRDEYGEMKLTAKGSSYKTL